MEMHIKIIGCLLILLALLHFFFPGYFEWKKEFGPVTLMNRQMVYVHMFFIALGVFLLGVLCLTSSNALVTTTLGRRLCLGVSIFWAARLYVQFFVYSSQLWKGKTFETVIHVVLALLWIYMTIVFTIAFLMGPVA